MWEELEDSMREENPYLFYSFGKCLIIYVKF